MKNKNYGLKVCIVFLRSEYESYILLEFLHLIVIKLLNREYVKIDLFIDSSFNSFNFFKSIEVFTGVYDLIEFSSSERFDGYDEYIKVTSGERSIRHSLLNSFGVENIVDKRYIDIQCQDTNSCFCKKSIGLKKYYVVHFTSKSFQIDSVRKFFINILNELDYSRKPYIVFSDTNNGVNTLNPIETLKLLSLSIAYIGIDSIESKLSLSLRIPSLIHTNSIKSKTILNPLELRTSEFSSERTNVERIKSFAARRWAIQSCGF